MFQRLAGPEVRRSCKGDSSPPKDSDWSWTEKLFIVVPDCTEASLVVVCAALWSDRSGLAVPAEEGRWGRFEKPYVFRRLHYWYLSAERRCWSLLLLLCSPLMPFRLQPVGHLGIEDHGAQGMCWGHGVRLGGGLKEAALVETSLCCPRVQWDNGTISNSARQKWLQWRDAFLMPVEPDSRMSRERMRERELYRLNLIQLLQSWKQEQAVCTNHLVIAQFIAHHLTHVVVVEWVTEWVTLLWALCMTSVATCCLK